MRSRILGVWFWLLLLVINFLPVSIPEVRAFHLMAGDITAKSDTANPANPLLYHFKMVTYISTINPYHDNTATFFFGDGTNLTVPRHSYQILPNQVMRQVFYVSHAYPAIGNYTIQYFERLRTAAIINIPNSGNTTFFLQTTISIMPQIGVYNSPQFKVPPLDVAAQGQIFVHFPGAYDLDHDSVSYRLITPLQNGGTQFNPIAANVSGYQLPNAFGGVTINDPVTGASAGNPARFDLNPVTGGIRWNVPHLLGVYNIAFVVEEWKRVPGRRAIKIGEITRDMQIRVQATTNIRPALFIPPDTCVVAGTLVEGFVTATDPDSPPDPLTIEAYSGIIPPATFTHTAAADGVFRWTPQCADISENPYQIFFKVSDTPPVNEPSLIDMKAWSVKVIGPKPTGLTASYLPGTLQAPRRVMLNWNPYLANNCSNAEKIHIYRRENLANFNPAGCQTGVPSSTGYLKIGEVAAGVSTFTDTNNGQGLKPGVTYCYVISATFPEPKRGESLASEQVCAEVPAFAPVLTNVDVLTTNSTTGTMLIKWSKPVKPNGTTPGEYRLSRTNGIPGTQPFSQVFRSGNPDDTIFIDTNLNTLDSAFHYKLAYVETGTGTFLPEPDSKASSVRLWGQANSNGIRLEWVYNTPWDNSRRKHLIFRHTPNAFVLIDSVLVGPGLGTHTDLGTYNNEPLIEGKEYCYYIETVGTFTNTRLPAVVRNRSQVFCKVFRDEVPPCPPAITLRSANCDSLSLIPLRPPFRNFLKWDPDHTEGCENDIAGYQVYYRQPGSEEFRFLSRTSDLTYVHQNFMSMAGCYAVTAVDSSGNESSFSNIECQEVCFFLELPNIFTPNGDGYNDTFRPRQSAFIKSVKFSVFNRWGVRVFEKTTGPTIDWAGENNGGGQVSDGVYYYLAEVEFAGTDPANSKRTFKGWVEVVR